MCFEMLDFYAQWLQKRNQFNNELRIWWRVLGAGSGYSAPFQIKDEVDGEPNFHMTFLNYCSNPITAYGSELSWFSLPVKTDTYRAVWAALGWTPSALQETCRFKSIVNELGFS